MSYQSAKKGATLLSRDGSTQTQSCCNTCVGLSQMDARRNCPVDRMYDCIYAAPLIRESFRLFFILFAITSSILAGLRTLVLLSSIRGLGHGADIMHPLLFLAAFTSSIVGLIYVKSDSYKRICIKHVTIHSARLRKRLRRGLLCVPIVITFFTMACLPMPTEDRVSPSAVLLLSTLCTRSFEVTAAISGHFNQVNVSLQSTQQLNDTVVRLRSMSVRPSVDVSRGVWPLMVAILLLHCLLVGLLRPATRILASVVIAFLHTSLVVISRLTTAVFVTATPLIFDCSEELFEKVSNFENMVALNSELAFFWRGVAANLLAFTMTTLVGLQLARLNEFQRWRYLFVILANTARDRNLRMVQNKLHLVSSSLVPTTLAADLEKEFAGGKAAWASPLVIYLRNVSFLSAELVGFCTAAIGSPDSSLPDSVDVDDANPAPSPGHVISFLNQFLSQMNALSEVHGCYPVHLRPDEILCVAGYPNVRVDHAQSCVELALEMRRLMSSIANAARVRLQMRISVHTGEAYAAVFGRSMLSFDLLGPDVTFIRRLRSVSLPGRVLVSRATFDQLPEGYEGEIGPSFFAARSTASSAGVNPETFYVQPRRLSDSKDNSPATLTNQSRWPSLAEAPSSLAACFARLARAATQVATTITSGGGKSTTLSPTPNPPLAFLFSVATDHPTEPEAREDLETLRLCLLRQLLHDDRNSMQMASGSLDEPDCRSEHACIWGRCSHCLDVSSEVSLDSSIDFLKTPKTYFLEHSFTGLTFSDTTLHQILHSCHLDNPRNFTTPKLSWPFDNGDETGESAAPFECPVCFSDSTNLPEQALVFPEKVASTDCCGSTEQQKLKDGCRKQLLASSFPNLTDDVLCPRVDTEFWALFALHSQLDVIRQTTLCLVPVFLCVTGVCTLLLTRVSIILVSLPTVFIWCLILATVFSSCGPCLEVVEVETIMGRIFPENVHTRPFDMVIRQAFLCVEHTKPSFLASPDRLCKGYQSRFTPLIYEACLKATSCFVPTLRQACLAFSLLLFLASGVFVSTIGRIGVFAWYHAADELPMPLAVDLRADWLSPPCLEPFVLFGCLFLLFPLLVSPGLGTPCASVLLSLLFCLLHLISALWRFTVHLPPPTSPSDISHLPDVLVVTNASSQSNSHRNPQLLLWVNMFADAVAGYFTFVLLVCCLPFQGRKLSICTANWTKRLISKKSELTGARLALSRLLVNCVPRQNLIDLLDPDYGNPLGLYSQDYSRTGVLVVGIRSSHMELAREATVAADCVRRLNKIICLFDDLATSGTLSTEITNQVSGDVLLQSVLKKICSQPDSSVRFPGLLKVYSVGQTLVFASGISPTASDNAHHLLHLVSFGKLLAGIFSELNAVAKRPEDAFYVEIGLHVGPSIAGIVGEQRPRFLLVEETVRQTLHLVACLSSPVNNGDGKDHHSQPQLKSNSVIVATPRFAAEVGPDCLPSGGSFQTVDGFGRLGTDNSVGALVAIQGIYIWPAEFVGTSNCAAFLRRYTMRLAEQSAYHKSSVERQRRTSNLMEVSVDRSFGSAFVPPISFRRSPQRPFDQSSGASPLSALWNSTRTVEPSPVGNESSTNGSYIQQQQPPVPPPPPLPPHKRIYSNAAEVFVGSQYQNFSKSGNGRLNRKFSSPTSRPDMLRKDTPGIRASSVDSQEPTAWVGHYSSSSITSPANNQDTVDRARFMAPVHIVNGYAQPHLLPPSPVGGAQFSLVQPGNMQQSRLSASPDCAASLSPNDCRRSLRHRNSPKASPYYVTNEFDDKDCSLPMFEFFRPDPSLGLDSARTTHPIHTGYAVPRSAVLLKSVEPIPERLSETLDVPDEFRPTSVNSEDLFLAAERACECSTGEVTSLSSNSMAAVVAEVKSNGADALKVSRHCGDSLHHNNPLYTDNEYESMTESANDLTDIGKRADDGYAREVDCDNTGDDLRVWATPSTDIDLGMRWLQETPVNGNFPHLQSYIGLSTTAIGGSDVSESIASKNSDGHNFPNYRRPSTPLGAKNYKPGLSSHYTPPVSSAPLPVESFHQQQQRAVSPKAFLFPVATKNPSRENTEECKTTKSIDLMSTRVAASIDDGMATDFDDATRNFGSQTSANQSDLESMLDEAPRPLSGMDSSWVSDKARASDFEGSNIPPGQPDNVDCCGLPAQMSDSMLVETGGPLEDDISEFSSNCGLSSIPPSLYGCSPLRHTVPSSTMADDGSSASFNPSDVGNSRILIQESSASMVAPIACASRPAQNNVRLPDVAPVGLPDFSRQSLRPNGWTGNQFTSSAGNATYANLPGSHALWAIRSRPQYHVELDGRSGQVTLHTTSAHIQFRNFSSQRNNTLADTGSDTNCSEYDNLENAYSASVSQPQSGIQPPLIGRLTAANLAGHQISEETRQRLVEARGRMKCIAPVPLSQPQQRLPRWKPNGGGGLSNGDRRGRARNVNPVYPSPFDAEIVSEARRISQRFQAMGWRSVLSIDSEDPDAMPNLLKNNVLNKQALAHSSKPLFLLPEPKSVSDAPPNILSRLQAINRPLAMQLGPANGHIAYGVDGFVCEEPDDDGDSDQRLLCTELGDSSIVQSHLYIPVNTWLEPRSASFDCLTGISEGIHASRELLLLQDELLRDGDLDEFYASSSSSEGKQECELVEEDEEQIASNEDCPQFDAHATEYSKLKLDHTKMNYLSHTETRGQYARRYLKRNRNTRSRLDRSLIQRRAANIRKLLPPELHQYILPGCVSSISPSSRLSSRMTSLSRGASIRSARNKPAIGVHLIRASHAGDDLGHQHRSSSDPQLSLYASNLAVSLF